MATNYAREKFTAGLHIVAEGEGGVRHRLLDAYVQEVHLAPPGNQLPTAISQRVDAFRHRMTSVAAQGDEGGIAATVAGMTDDEVVAAVHELVRIALELQSL